MSDELVPKQYQDTNSHTEADKEIGVIKEGRGMGDRHETEWERVRVGPKLPCDGNLMRLNHVPTGQLTSACSSLTNPPSPFMPKPDANKENQGKYTQTDFMFITS